MRRLSPKRRKTLLVLIVLAVIILPFAYLASTLYAPRYPNSELVAFYPPTTIHFPIEKKWFIEFYFVYESGDSLDDIYDWYKAEYNIPTGNLLLRDILYFDNSVIRAGHTLELYSQQIGNTAEFTHAYVIGIDLDPSSLDYYLPNK